MNIICVEGAAPGNIVATLAHGTRLRRLAMTIVRHPAGGWQVRQKAGEVGPRCHAVNAAILLEASEVLADEMEDALAA